MAKSPQDNFIRCHAALHELLSRTIPSLQNAVDVWHHKTTTQPCSNPAQCPPYKKPSLKNKSCQECIAWATAIEAQVYPPWTVGSLQWMNANSTLFSKDPLEAMKLFVLRMPANNINTYSTLADFDTASLLMIMGKFKEFHHGDQIVYDNIQKIAQIRNALAHLKLRNSIHLDDQTFNNYWTDITNLVNCLPGIGRPYFTQQTAKDVITKLTEIKDQTMPENIQQEALKPLIEDIVLKTLEDNKPNQPTTVTATQTETQGSRLEEVKLCQVHGCTEEVARPDCMGFRCQRHFDDLVQSIAEDLRKHYKANNCQKKMYPWKPGNCVDLERVYVPVTIDITIPGLRPIKERLKSYQEIFETDDDTRYILTGNPGQGKSTFCAKLAFDWCYKSSLSPLKDVQLLFIIQLATLTHSSDIEEAICSQLLQSSNVDISTVGKVIRTLGKEVVIVLDGLDEAPLDLFKHEFTGNLVQIIRSKQLGKCCVLVTTRPWREREIISESPVYRRLELQKMKRSDVRKYVTKLFSLNPKDLATIALGKRLLQYIDENKLVLDTSTPLMVLLTSWFWIETNGKRGIPDRISEVYEEIATIMYENFMKTSTNQNAQSDQERQPGVVERLVDRTRRLLPLASPNLPVISQQDKFYFSLGEFSVSGLTPWATKIVFTEDEIKKSCGEKCLEEALGMGIMCRRSEHMHALQFFHKSGQEFYAGYYLRHHPSKLRSYLKKLKTVSDVLSIAPVLLFASRLQSAAKMIIQKLMLLFKSEIDPQTYYEDELSADETRPIQQYIELCLQCNFEADAKAEFVSILGDLFMEGEVLFYGISSKTAITLAYFMEYCDPVAIRGITLRPIAHVGDINICYGVSHAMFIMFHIEGLTTMKHHSTDMIQQVYDSFVEANPELHKVWIREYPPPHLVAYIPCIQAYEGLPPPSETNILPIIHCLKYVKVERLNVNHFKLDDDLLKTIENGEIKSLSLLKVRSTASTEQQMTRLASSVHMIPLLRVLDISYNKVQPGQTLPILANNLKHCAELRELRMFNMQAPANDMELFAQNVPSKLTELGLEGNEMNDAVASHLVETLPTTLKRVHFALNRLSQSKHNELMHSIHSKLPCLRTLHVWGSAYAVDLVRHGGLTLESCQQMDELLLASDNSDLIPEEVVEKFVEKGMQQARNITLLSLYGIRLGSRKSFYRLVEASRQCEHFWYTRNLLPDDVLPDKLDDFVILV
ncbi:uncharacterized protein [Amphiura filiformis]|uniref:uncharacterized protein n=1 Tax=Amphiura filiformis TaxID=82378 RepID=UPI003B2154BC